MRRLTRAVDPEDVRDLLERVPRANVAFNDAGAIAAAPVAFRFQAGRYWVGVSREGPGPAPRPGDQVALLIDDGCYYFELRGIWIRGQALLAEQIPEGVCADLDWLQLLPDKVVAWDYGTLREVEDA